MIKFNKEIILVLYRKMVSATGGTYGIRDESLLDSAIEAPYHTFGGIEMNDIHINFSDDDIIFMGLGLASGHLDYDKLYEFIEHKI